jgi:hypothetical protein
MESDVRLAQPDDLMFERNVGHFAKRGREVEIWLEGIPEPKVGFLAGLDEQFLQLCLTKNAALSNIRIDLVVSMEDTGRTIGTLIKKSRGTPDEEAAASKIKEKINHFQNRASTIYGGSR